METSNRGGYRYGAGRRPGWKSGETKAVKLPVALIPRLLELAKILDEGGEVLVLKHDNGDCETPQQGIIRWNIYNRVQDYDRRKKEHYWSDWELKASKLTEQDAQQTVKIWKKHKWELESRGDYGHIVEEYDIRCERLVPATMPQSRRADAVLGGGVS